MKKALQILVIIGGPLTGLLYYFGNACGSVCDKHSFYNPFGVGPTNDICTQVCYFTPHPLFWIVADITVIITIMYIYTVIKSPKGPRIISMK